jgi:hypothetical protein
VLKIKNANSGKDEKTKKGQQLVTPLHYPPCSGGLQLPQMKLQTEHGAAGPNFDHISEPYLFVSPAVLYSRKNRLSIFSFIGKVRDVWLVR